MTDFNNNLNNLFKNFKQQQMYQKYQKASEEDKKNSKLWKDIDVNGDGKINSKDLSKLNSKEKSLLANTKLFDINADGKFNQADIDMFIKSDVNGDGKVTTDEMNFIAKYKDAFSKAMSAQTGKTHKITVSSDKTKITDTEYDSNNKASKLTRYEYDTETARNISYKDGVKNQQVVKLSDGTVNTYTYDKNGKTSFLRSEKPNNVVMEYKFKDGVKSSYVKYNLDANKNVTSEIHYSYDKNGKATTDSKITNKYDKNGKKTKSVQVFYGNAIKNDVKKVETSYLYVNDGRVAATEMKYDSKGTLLSRSDDTKWADGSGYTVSHDYKNYGSDNWEQTTVARGYDSKGNTTWSFECESDSKMPCIKSGNGPSDMSFGFIGGKEITLKNGDSMKVDKNGISTLKRADGKTIQYDENGMQRGSMKWLQKCDESLANVKGSKFKYDSLGRITKFVASDGTNYEVFYNSDGSDTFTISALCGKEKTSNHFDAKGELTGIAKWNKDGKLIYQEDIDTFPAGTSWTTFGNMTVTAPSDKDVKVRFSMNFETGEVKFFADDLTFEAYDCGEESPFKNLVIEGNRNHILGSESDDQLTVKGNNNVIELAGGDDNLILKGKNNTVNTGLGNDVIDAMGNKNTIDSGAGKDMVSVQGTSNKVDTGDGNDWAYIYGDKNTVNTGAGNDEAIIYMGSNNKINTGAGNDKVSLTHSGENNTFNTGAGNDTVKVNGGSNTINTGAGKDNVTVYGSGNKVDTGADNDKVEANGNKNTINTGDGADTVNVKGESNNINTGADDDSVKVQGYYNTINTGTGDDYVMAEGNKNTVNTSAGDDYVVSTGSDNKINTGAGLDSVKAEGSQNTISTDAGADYVNINGSGNKVDTGTDNDLVKVKGDKNTIDAGEGVDTVNVSGNNVLVLNAENVSRVYEIGSLGYVWQRLGSIPKANRTVAYDKQGRVASITFTEVGDSSKVVKKYSVSYAEDGRMKISDGTTVRYFDADGNLTGTSKIENRKEEVEVVTGGNFDIDASDKDDVTLVAGGNFDISNSENERGSFDWVAKYAGFTNLDTQKYYEPKYDSQGRISELKWIGTQKYGVKTVRADITVSYSDNGEFEITKTGGLNLGGAAKIVYKYDPDGNKISTTKYNVKGDAKIRQDIFEDSMIIQTDNGELALITVAPGLINDIEVSFDGKNLNLSNFPTLSEMMPPVVLVTHELNPADAFSCNVNDRMMFIQEKDKITAIEMRNKEDIDKVKVYYDDEVGLKIDYDGVTPIIIYTVDREYK